MQTDEATVRERVRRDAHEEVIQFIEDRAERLKVHAVDVKRTVADFRALSQPSTSNPDPSPLA